MVVRLRLVITALVAALLVYGALQGWASYRRMTLVGLTDRRCSADGWVVTGRVPDDWGGLCGYDTANARLIASGTRPDVVMIGDSLTAGWPEIALPGGGAGIVTRGVGGQSSSQILLRFRQDALSLRPKIIHMLMGTNDLAGLTGPVTLDQVAGNVLTMAELAHLHGHAVILGTVPPARDFLWFRFGDPAPDVRRLNERLRWLAAHNGLVLADYHAVLARPDGSLRQELYMDDGIHLNAAGYAAIQPVFEAALAQARRRPAR